ncbi:MAG: hypothetical protein ACK4KT_05105 [Thermaurantimonas sp.]
MTPDKSSPSSGVGLLRGTLRFRASAGAAHGRRTALSRALRIPHAYPHTPT